jgi:hypothetical protein
MRTLVFSLVFFSGLLSVTAQIAPKIALRNAAPGKISVSRGKARAVIDLSREVAGCAYASGQIKRLFKDCAAPPAKFDLVDAAVKNDRTYLLISTDAMGNCNVCGRCGASASFGLIWLELDAALRVLQKKDTPIDYCRLDIVAVSAIADLDEETGKQDLKLNFENDVLSVEFEKTIFGEVGESGGYEFSRLEYDRKTPEKGFIIKNERRSESSIKDQ